MSKRLIQPFRRKMLVASSLAALSPGLSAQTPSYPGRPVRFVVPTCGLNTKILLAPSSQV